MTGARLRRIGSRRASARIAGLVAPRRRSVSLAETAAIALLVVLLLGQLLVFGANTALLSAVAAIAEILIGLVLLLMLRPPEALWQGLAPVLLPLAFALCWAGLPAIAAPWFPPPRPELELFPLEWAKLVGAFACVVAGAALGARPLATRRFVDIFLVGGFLWTLVALTLRQADPWHVWGHDKGQFGTRFTATLLTTNSAGCAFGMFSLLAAGRVQVAIERCRARGWTGNDALFLAAHAIIAATTLASCSLTQSRASLSFTIVAIGLLQLHWARVLRRQRRPGRHSWVATAIVALLVAGLVLGMPIRDRYSEIGGDARDRLSAMIHFGAIVAKAPWFGYGLGAFPAVNARHLTPDNVKLLWNFGAAHSAPVHAALEAGIPFVLFVIIAICFAARRIIATRRHSVADPLMVAQVLAVALVFACSLADIELSVPALVAMTAVLSGLVLGRSERASRVPFLPTDAP